MPITFVGAGAAAAGNNASLTPSLPSGLQPGDLMLIAFSARGNGTIGTPSGWTERWTIQHTSSGINKIKLLYRFYQSGDAAVQVTYTGGANGHTTLAQCCAFRGVDPNSPFDTQGTASSNASQQNIGPISGITPSTNGACVLVIGHKADDCTSVDTLSGDSLTWVEIGEPKSTSGNDATMVWDYAILPGSPVTITNKTFTVVGGTAQTGLGIMDSLRPAPETRYASLAATEANDSISSSAQVLVSASVAAVSQDASAAASASVAIAAFADIIEADDTLAASAVSSSTIYASLAQIEADDAISASAAVLVSGQLSQAEADDACAASASVLIAASAQAVEEADSCSASAAVSISASAAMAASDCALTSSAQVLLSCYAALQEEPDLLVATASALSAISASMEAVEAPDSCSASAAVLVAGSVDAACEDERLSAALAVLLAAQLDAVEARDSVHGFVAVLASASLFSICDDAVLASTCRSGDVSGLRFFAAAPPQVMRASVDSTSASASEPDRYRESGGSANVLSAERPELYGRLLD